jgi:hypothetical protein
MAWSMLRIWEGALRTLLRDVGDAEARNEAQRIVEAVLNGPRE